MSFTNVKLIFLRELRDQLRDRRTLFTIFVLPLMLYPLMGMAMLQVQQFLKEHDTKVWIIGAEALPDQPPLLSGDRFAESLSSEQESRLLTLELKPHRGRSFAQIKTDAESDIRLGKCDAVVYFPPDFAERMARFRQSLPERPDGAVDELGGLSDAVPRPEILQSTASDKSKVAADRVESILRRWREAIVQENLRQSNLPAAAARPFELVNTDVAQETSRRAALWSKILPFVLMVWALTGAFYPAIDLCAGEKERGTLETLLSSPAARSEIVVGKLLTVMSFSIATSLLNLFSATALGTFVVTRLQAMGPQGLQLDFGPPPLVALVWLVPALVPISALFSAVSLAVAAFARSSKEGQYYLMPILMVSLPLMMLPMLPTSELDLGFALIPLSGLMLLLRTLIEGQYGEALRYSVPVLGVTAGCCLLAIRWAVDQFNNESVLFRESERLDLGIWLRHLVRDRDDLPTAGEAILCGVVLLVLHFLASFAVPPHQTWPQFVTTTLILQVAFIATPACLMAIMLTRRPLETLRLGRPSFLLAVPAAGLLAALLHPAYLWLSEAIGHLYPMNPKLVEQIKPVMENIAAQPLWQVLLLIALTPAICEELAFRGFILSGLRRLGHKWGAIALASLFFGLSHGIIQQSLGAFLVGIVIGYVAVKTGSLWPGVLYHLVHNSLGVLLSRVTPEVLESNAPLKLIFAADAPGQVSYQVPTTIVAAILAAGLLWWFKSLPYHRLAEERLQEALDHQSAGLAAKSAA